MNRYSRNIQIPRYLFLLGPVLGTLARVSPAAYLYVVLLGLIIIINSRLRLAMSKVLPVTASLLAEILLVLYLNSLHPGFVYLMLFATMLDSVLLVPGLLLLPFLAGVGLLYALRLMPFDWIFITLSFYLVFFLFLLQLRQEFQLREETEALYDRLRQSNYELEGTRARLLDYSRQVEKITLLEERNRIARELHDSLGHALAGILMQVDAARQVIPANQAKGLELLDSAYQNISHSMDTVRDTVRRLRPAGYKNPASSLAELARTFRQTTGVQVDVRTEGTPYELFPSVETALYRNTQEALTNALRHGKAKHVLVQLTFRPEAVELDIRDDGAGAPGFSKGFGLSGMEERTELAGGSVSFNGENGFQIKMHIPRREM